MWKVSAMTEAVGVLVLSPRGGVGLGIAKMDISVEEGLKWIFLSVTQFAYILISEACIRMPFFGEHFGR